VWTTRLGYEPGSVSSQGRVVWRISPRAMRGEQLFGTDGPGMKYLQRSASATKNTAFGQVQYWDGVEALWGYADGTTYVRFRDGASPASKGVRVAPLGGVLTFDGTQGSTVRGLTVTGGQYAVHLTHGARQNTIEGNDLRGGSIRVHIDGASENRILTNTIETHGMSTLQFTNGDRDRGSYARIVNRHMYDENKFIVGETVENDTGISIASFQGQAHGNVIQGNTIRNGIVGIRLWESKTTGTKILDNTIAQFSAQGIWVVGDYTEAEIGHNLFYDSDHHMRIQVESPMDLTIYANRFHQRASGDKGGKHLHFSIIGQNVTAPAKIQVYHNSFAGGGWALDMGFEGSRGGIPGVEARNNIFATTGMSSTGSTGGATIHQNWSGKLWQSDTVPDFTLPPGHPARDSALSLLGRPGITTAYYQDRKPDFGAVQGSGAPAPPTDDPPPVPHNLRVIQP
jgi:hypothetical protein